MKEQIFVRLRVFSTAKTPEELAAIIGLKFDHSWKIGDKRSKTIICESTNGGVITSGLSETKNLEEHFIALFERVMPCAGQISALAAEDTIEISCVIYAPHSPVLSFTASAIRQMSILNASLDIDTYII